MCAEWSPGSPQHLGPRGGSAGSAPRGAPPGPDSKPRPGLSWFRLFHYGRLGVMSVASTVTFLHSCYLIFAPMCYFFCTVLHETMETLGALSSATHTFHSCYSPNKAFSKTSLRSEYWIFGIFLFSLKLVDPGLETDTFHTWTLFQRKTTRKPSQDSPPRTALHEPFLGAILQLGGGNWASPPPFLKGRRERAKPRDLLAARGSAGPVSPEGGAMF